MREDYAIVLDYLPNGYANSFKKEPIAQVIGKEFFSLLELVAKQDVKLTSRDEVYIGQDKREKIQYIKGRLIYSKLTASARSELNSIVEQIVANNEEKFVNFFNKTGAITIRQHSLELLPNIGKKHMVDLLDQREEKPFENFADIAARVKLMPDPKRVIIERILEEIKGDTKYHLFVRAPRTDRGVENRPQR